VLLAATRIQSPPTHPKRRRYSMLCGRAEASPRASGRPQSTSCHEKMLCGRAEASPRASGRPQSTLQFFTCGAGCCAVGEVRSCESGRILMFPDRFGARTARRLDPLEALRVQLVRERASEAVGEAAAANPGDRAAPKKRNHRPSENPDHPTKRRNAQPD